MIQASNAYKSAVDGNGRRVQARVYLDGTLLDLPIGEVKLYRGCCGSKPDAGSIYVPYSDVEVKGTIDAAGGTPMRVDIGFMTGSAWEWVTVGSYVVSRIETQNDKVTIHGIGTIGLFGGQKAVVTETSYSAIATQIGTAVGYDVQFVGLDPSGSFESPPEGTYRDILAQIAYNLGGFLTESADGKWTIAGFCSGTAVLVNADRMQEPPSFGYESYSLNGVEVESAEIDLTMGNPLFDPWDYLVFGEVYAKMNIDRSSGNLIVEDGSTLTGDIAFDDNGDGHLLYTYSGEPNVLFTLLREHLIVSQPNSHIVPCLQIVHTLNGGLSTFIGAHVESSTEQEATIEGVLNRQVIEANAAAKEANAKATEALESVQETTNYFWANEEGAHVTKKTKAEFLDNPEAGGGNFLAQADKVAVRDGTKEMAAFGLFGQQMTNREGVRYFSLDSLNSTGDMFAQAGPFDRGIGTLTYATLPVMPTEGKPIYTSVDGASGALFEMVAGTAGEAESTRFGVTYKVTYDGAQSFTASETHPENDEQGVPAGTYGARISQIMYWANTNMPSMTFGTSEESRGKFSATFGEGLMAMYPNQTAVGMYNENLPDDLFEVGGGTDTDTRKTLFAVEANGDIYCAGKVNAGGAVVSDFVVEEGTSGIWSYRKWSNGDAECWGKFNKSVAAGAADSTSIYHYPFTFTSSPVALMSIACGGADLYRGHFEQGGTTAAQVRVTLINKHTAAVTFTVSVYSKGKWK